MNEPIHSQPVAKDTAPSAREREAQANYTEKGPSTLTNSEVGTDFIHEHIAQDKVRKIILDD